MKSSAAVIEVVVGEVVDAHALRRQAVPGVEIPREQRGHAGLLVVAEVVPADLAVIVGQAVWIRDGLRQQQRPRVLVGVAGEQHHFRRLEVLDAVGDVGHAGHAALAVHFDRRDVRARDDLQAACLLRLRDRRHRGRVLRVHVAAALVAEAVIHAGGTALIRPRVDGGRPRKRMPAEAGGSRRHHVGETRSRAAAASDTRARADLRRCCRGGSMRPRMLPAWPDTPISYSTLS